MESAKQRHDREQRERRDPRFKKHSVLTRKERLEHFQKRQRRVIEDNFDWTPAHTPEPTHSLHD